MNGKGSLKYEDDGTTLEGNFFNGALNGKARLFDDKENLIFVGLYQAGMILKYRTVHKLCFAFS